MVCGHRALRELRLFVRQKFARIIRRRGQDRAVAVEKAVKMRVQRVGRAGPVRVRLLHQVAQFFPRARIQEIERIIFERGVDAGILGERLRTIGDGRIAQILQAMERGQLEFEVALQIGLGHPPPRARCAT